MAQYVIKLPHTSEDEKGEDTLKKFAFGFKSGENTDWAYIDSYIDSYIDANSKKEAIETVPEFLKDKVRAHEVGMFTPEKIRAAHEEA